MKRTEINRLLPVVIQRTILPGTPLDAILKVMEGLQAPSEDVLEHLDSFFNAYRAPDAFVPYLASWVDLERLFIAVPEEFEGVIPPFPSGTARLRELVASAAYLAKWRGTAKGLIRFLEIATGVHGFTIDENVPEANGLPRPFHIVVHAPAETAPYQALITRIVDLEKPAYVTYELDIRSAPSNPA